MIKVRLESEPHPINSSLVEIELEEEERSGMSIPFPAHLKPEVKFTFDQNSKMLPECLQAEKGLSFLFYKTE